MSAWNESLECCMEVMHTSEVCVLCVRAHCMHACVHASKNVVYVYVRVRACVCV